MQLIKEVLKKVDAAVVGKNGDALPEVGKDEKVLGTLPDELQRFYVVMDGMVAEEKVEMTALVAKMLDKKAKAARDSKGECQCPECNGTIGIMRNRIETVSDMFWGAVRRAIPGAIKTESIGLRKGFQIVACPQKREAEMIAMRIPLSADLAAMLNRI